MISETFRATIFQAESTPCFSAPETNLDVREANLYLRLAMNVQGWSVETTERKRTNK